MRVRSATLILIGVLLQSFSLTKVLADDCPTDKFELWSKTKWDAETDQALSASAEDLALLLNGLSI